MDTIEFKGYRGSVRFSSDDGIFHGRIIGINDVVSFEGGTVKKLVSDFKAAVVDYLDTCKEIGKEPERAYSGNIPLRIGSELHRRMAIEAETAGSSLNGWIKAQLEKRLAAS